ncbi:MAG TPA: hypothetical protein VGN34_25565 [Ktedonobacteraceae bacterium]
MKKMVFTQRNFLLSIFILACSFWLASCSYQPGEQARAAMISPLIGNTLQKCGAIALNPIGKLVDAKTAIQSGICFENAYRHCQIATLLFTESGVDTVTMHTFTIARKERACVVTSLVQHRVLPMLFKITGTYTCTAVNRTKNALLIKNCGAEGTITIPLSNT